MSEFLKALHSGKVLLMDGAMGTELQRAGIGEGECYELWNLTHPEKVRAIHRSYVFAGADCLLTNTFQANRCSLAKHGLQDKLEEINEAGVGIARSAADVKSFVIGDIGPDRTMHSDEDVGGIVRSLRLADALLLETWPDPSPCLFILNARKQKVIPDGIPILVSFTYRKNSVPGLPRIMEDPRAMVSGQGSFGIVALGVNCGRDIDMDDIIHIVKEYRAATDLPIFVRPNAGTPTRVGNQWEYPVTPAMMAERLPELLEAGVSMIGGCCGTTPEHIAAFRPIIDKWNARK
jgi:5-methyltetrahydrofolate--homocysteine methyltransferase